MKKLSLILLCIVLVLFVSCENSTKSTGDLTVRIASPRAGNLFLLDPLEDEEHVSSIKVTLTSTFNDSQTGSPIVKEATVVNGKADFTNLQIGKYNIVGKAYNKGGLVLASGSSEIVIKPNQNTVALDINTLEGSGDFKFRIHYEFYGIPEEQLDIRTSITDSNGNVVDPNSYVIDESSPVEVIISGTLPSDSYIFTAKVYVDSILVDGYVAAFRTYPGSQSGARYNILGTPGNSTGSVTVTNSTSNKMVCSIETGTPSGNSITLTAKVTELPESYSLKDLTFQWYKNAEPIANATTGTLTVTDDSAYIQYSVIVKSNKKGSWTSATTYV